MLAWAGRNRVVVFGAAAAALALGLLIMYGFDRWWPGCQDFNTDLQRSVTLERAQAVADRCQQVGAGDVQEALVVDTVFPVLYVIFVAGMLLLVASSRQLPSWGSRAAVWFARAVIVGGVLDLTRENGSLVLVTLQGWPPSPVGATEVLLVVAGIAAWTKWVLMVLSVIVLHCLLLLVIALRLARPSRRTT